MREGYDREREIEEETGLPDRCLHVNCSDSSEWFVDADDAKMLRASMLEYGQTKFDRLIDLTTVYGSEFSVLASSISSWIVSTGASRARSRIINAAFEKARKERQMIDGKD